MEDGGPEVLGLTVDDRVLGPPLMGQSAFQKIVENLNLRCIGKSLRRLVLMFP